MTRGVAERAPWLGRRVEVVIQNDDFSRAPRGKIVQGEHTGIHLRITIRQTDLVVRGFLEGRLLRSLGYLTIAVDHPTVGRLGGGVTGTDLVSQLLIPDHLVTILGDRERQATTTGWINCQAVLLNLATGSVAQSSLHHFLWIGSGAVARINIHVPGIRILLQQLLLTFTQLVSVLICILRIDPEQGLLVLERINPKSAVRLETGRSLAEAAFVGRNCPVCIAGLDSSPRRQRFTQFGSFFRTDSSKSTYRQST
ncbi:hypothetical protein D3C84_530120 [compost metagenome]